MGLIRKWVGTGPEPPVTEPIFGRPTSHYNGYNYATWLMEAKKGTQYGNNLHRNYLNYDQPTGWEIVPRSDFKDVCLNFLLRDNEKYWQDWGNKKYFYTFDGDLDTVNGKTSVTDGQIYECRIGHHDSDKWFWSGDWSTSVLPDSKKTTEAQKNEFLRVARHERTTWYVRDGNKNPYKHHYAYSHAGRTGLLYVGGQQTVLLRQQAAAPAPAMFATPTAFIFDGFEFALRTQDTARDTTWDAWKNSGGRACDDEDHPLSMGEFERFGWIQADARVMHHGDNDYEAFQKVCAALALGTDHGWGTKQVSLSLYWSCNTKTGVASNHAISKKESCDFGTRSTYFAKHRTNPGPGQSHCVWMKYCDGRVMMMRELANQ